MSFVRLYRGTMGSGKTLSGVHESFLVYMLGRRCDNCGESFDFIQNVGVCPFCYCKDFHRYKVVSNIGLTFPHERLQKLEDLLKLKDSHLFLDEIWKIAHSRMSGKKRNKFANMILAESRHREVDISGTTQHEKQVDLWIRQNTDTIAVPRINKELKVCEVFVFSYYNDVNFATSSNFIKKYSYPIEPIFNLYNTREIVEGMKLDVESKKELLEELKAQQQIDKLQENHDAKKDDSDIFL